MKISKSKLALFMLKAGIDSARTLSKIAGISANTISRFSNGGKVTVPTLRKIAAALNCDPAELVEME